MSQKTVENVKRKNYSIDSSLILLVTFADWAKKIYDGCMNGQMNKQMCRSR